MMTKKEKDALVMGNMGYVVTLARQYKSDILTTDDLVSEGSIGLMKAAERYDKERGKPFVTFAAPYIRHAIEQAISRLTGEMPVLSTDESLPVGSKNNFTLLNVLEDKNSPHADMALEHDALSDDFVAAIGRLDERQQAVITRYYGIGREHMSMVDIGMELNLKRERVRQIRDQALRKIKKITG